MYIGSVVQTVAVIQEPHIESNHKLTTDLRKGHKAHERKRLKRDDPKEQLDPHLDC
jgi:hypothetical protein